MIFFVLLFGVCHGHIGSDRTVPVPRGYSCWGLCHSGVHVHLYDELSVHGVWRFLLLTMTYVGLAVALETTSRTGTSGSWASSSSEASHLWWSMELLTDLSCSHARAGHQAHRFGHQLRMAV